MKQVLSIISALLLLITFGCTLETQNDSQETKVETSSTETNAKKEMSVHFIDVGQGDSILIQSPEGKNMLVDGGKREKGKDVVTYLRQHGVDKLDYVVATHPDADHIGGLLAVLNSVSIKNFVDSGKEHTTQTYEQMLQLILDKHIPFIVPSVGDTIPLDSDIEITVLNTGENVDDNNEASIVLKVQYEDVSFLLTGDADAGVEKSMIKEYNLKSTVLKAGHHGSDTSSSDAFIREVQPEVTILSYGENNMYGHPTPVIVTRLKKANSDIYSTAEIGNIVVRTDGKDYTVATDSLRNDKESVAETPLYISEKDVREEIVGITNQGEEAVNLEGWQLVSVAGNQVYSFPNMTIDAGETIYITSGPEAREDETHLKWTSRQMWRNGGDAAQLLNEKGVVLSEVK
ncbi:MBL fold metallo-hydrolase [Psychrobacillus soli]|uniref:MBL fold metallo-hydrolase n=1 Tax=Psychrobacillus soli TaxID=1543965 RepID=A0A544TCW9_9BACI|nr:MBL fold metallo-hydrolase [Psychrobacillus soli]TQR15313.1 MBL fold metallo-hydrolase [Psychrobacillus soli]